MPKKRDSYNRTSRDLKSAGIKGGVGQDRGKLAPERTSKLPIPGAPKVPEKRKVGTAAINIPPQTFVLMAKDKANGLSDREIADKYALSKDYVRDALKSRFLNNAVGREVLKGVLLNNAIGCGMKVAEKIDELTPMQAVIATGIMTQRYVDVEKHVQSQPPEVDYEQLGRVGDLLSGIRTDAGLDDETIGQVIDLDASDA